MTRILLFVSSMQSGGAESVAALLCNRWAEGGHEVVLVPTFSGRETDRAVEVCETYAVARIAEQWEALFEECVWNEPKNKITGTNS